MILVDYKGPFTVAKLLDIAIAAEAAKDRVTVEHALACASWMEEHGYTGDAALNFVGPFGELPKLKRGDKVRVKKGALIWTTHPSVRKEVGGDNHKRAGKTHTVTVDRMSPGHGTALRRGEIEIRNPTVTWAGPGGYWCEVSLNDIEVLP